MVAPPPRYLSQTTRKHARAVNQFVASFDLLLRFCPTFTERFPLQIERVRGVIVASVVARRFASAMQPLSTAPQYAVGGGPPSSCMLYLLHVSCCTLYCRTFHAPPCGRRRTPKTVV